MPNPKEQENLEKSSNKQGFGEKALGFLKKSFSALAGAAVGAAIGSFIPVVGTVIGGIIGAIAGRAIVEPAISFLFGADEKTAPTSVATEKTVATPSTEQAGINNTAQMTAQLGGPKQQISSTASLIEAPVAAPKSVLNAGANPLNAPFFDKQASVAASSPMINPAALPKPRPYGGAAPAA